MKNLSTVCDSRTMLLVAQTYAKLFGVQLRIQGSTAYVNGNIITIPRIRRDCDPRTVYGYIAHEAGHIKHTSMLIVIQIKGELFELFNILEDARIERLMGREYVGVKANLCRLALLVNGCSDRGEFMSMPVLTKIEAMILWATQYHHCAYTEQRSNLVFAMHAVRSLMKHHAVYLIYQLALKLNEAKNSDDALKLAKAILLLIRERKNYKDAAIDLANKGLGTPDGDAFNDNALKEFFNVSKGAGKALNDSVKALKSLVAEKELNTSSSIGAARADYIENNCSSSGQSSSREDFGVLDDSYSNPGSQEFVKNGCDHKLVNTISRFTRAYVEKMHDIAERGRRLDIKRLIRVPFGEENIFKTAQLELEHDTHIHLLVDASSSMLTSDGGANSRSEEANRCALAIAMALEHIDNVTRAVTHFPGQCSEYSITCKPNERINDYVGSRFDQRPRGSTPLAQAMWYAFSEMKFSNRQRNVLIVITDGMPDSVENVKQAFEFAKKNNVEIYAISIRSELASKLFDNAYIVEDATRLNECMQRIVRDIFSTKKLAA